MEHDVESWPTGRLLSTAARLVEQSWEDRLRRVGVTHAGLIALHCLLDGPLPQRRLAEACRVTDQTMSRTVDRLARAGYVTRGTDPRDERRVVISATAAGRAVHARAVAAERDEALNTAVPDQEALRAQLVHLVRTLGP